jgi:sugar phosphate permease
MSAAKGDTLAQRSPIFYSWIIWWIATLGFLASSPGQSFTVSLFFDRFIEDLALSRTTVSALYSSGTLIAALSLTFIGRWVDRVGNRLAGTVISGLLAISLVLMAFVAGPVMLLVGFVLIRALGQGAIPLTSSNIIAQWFRRRRGLAMGITSFVFMLSQAVIVLGLRQLIETVGWRVAWLVQASIVAAVVVPLFALLVRNRPEDVGLFPDGARSPANNPARTDAHAEANFTLKQATHTPIFWLFLLMQMLNAGWMTGLIIHQISLFEVLGHGSSVPVRTFSLAATVAAGTTLVAGPLVNRMKPQLIAAAQMLLLGSVLVLAMTMSANLSTLVYGVLLGMFLGVWPVFDGVVWPNVFGRTHYGAIRGLVQAAGVAGSALGPIIFSLSFDARGTYNLALWAGIGLAASILAASLIVRAPRAPVNA